MTVQGEGLHHTPLENRRIPILEAIVMENFKCSSERSPWATFSLFYVSPDHLRFTAPNNGGTNKQRSARCYYLLAHSETQGNT